MEHKYPKKTEIRNAYRVNLDKQLQEEKNLEVEKMPNLKMWEEVEIRDKREIDRNLEQVEITY